MARAIQSSLSVYLLSVSVCLFVTSIMVREPVDFIAVLKRYWAGDYHLLSELYSFNEVLFKNFTNFQVLYNSVFYFLITVPRKVRLFSYSFSFKIKCPPLCYV